MRVTAWLVPLLALSLAIAGCSASAQPPAAPVAVAKDPLAGDLYVASSETDLELIRLEQTLPNAVNQGDAATIEKAILRADELKRAWHTKAAPATGKLADAAQKYEESISLRTQMFEQGSAAARLHSVEASRAMVRFQTQGWDLAQAAQDAIKDLE